MSQSDRTARPLAALLFGVYAVLALVFVFTARVNIDEGVYLAAGQLVWDGALPYRDYPFSQGPVVPIAYGLPAALPQPGIDRKSRMKSSNYFMKPA